MGPQLDEGRDVWRVPVVLTYAVVDPVGEVGKVLVSAVVKVLSHTPVDKMKERACAVYEQSA